MHVLFLVHGMGKHDQNWGSAVITKIEEVASSYRRFSNGSLGESVAFEPLRYDHIFDQVLNRWHGNFTEIADSEASAQFPQNEISNLLESMDEEERSFFWSHISDVLIYRFFPLWRDRVRMELIGEISGKVDHYRQLYGNNVKFSFLAHSLGTAVLHDSLHLLGSTEWEPGIANVKGPPHTRFQSVFKCANTGLILESGNQVYQSIVRPRGSFDDPDKEYLNQYFNINHRYDPITVWRRFSPEGWGVNYREVTLQHAREPNVHDINHFLDHPKLHIPLLRVIAGFRAVTPAEELAAVESYHDFDTSEAIAHVRERVEIAARDAGNDPGLADLVKFWITLKDLIR